MMTNVNKLLISIHVLLILLQSSFASNKFPDVYPYTPMKLHGESGIYYDMVKFTEDRTFIKNFKTIIELGFAEEGRTKKKPWSGSYWPLAKGTIADPFEKSKIPYYVDIKWIAWKGNVKEFKRRKQKILERVYELSEDELAKLAPSEKYDLLLGDLSFDLTHRLWAYMNSWGSKKDNAFKLRPLLLGDYALEEARKHVQKGWYTNVESAFRSSWTIKSSLAAKMALKLKDEKKYTNIESAWDKALELASSERTNYVEEEKNSRIAGWEGICNGWATSAGLEPRPRKSVSFLLPNGKKLKFYPSDIRGLVSLFYVNSLIQDSVWNNNLEKDGMPKTQGTVSVGLRCNMKHAKKDKWGRKYDHRDDAFNGRNRFTDKREARCSGVHPAKWHIGLVNMIGKQGRSFIVERKVGPEVDNHPMYSYKMEYFHPNKGDFSDDIMDVVVQIDKSDQFRRFRHPESKYIVGVKNTIVYLNYMKPRRKDVSSEKDDLDVEKVMLYDLELDKNFNIVGGQWRAKTKGVFTRGGKPGTAHKKPKENWNMPDFFWAITKNYKSSGHFDEKKVPEPWVDKRKAPPASWKKVAIGNPQKDEGSVVGQTDGPHGFYYKSTLALGGPANCRYKNKKTGEFVLTLCEYATNKPQPLLNIVNVLIDLAK